MDNTVKVAALISYITAEAGAALDEQQVRTILTMVAELRCDWSAVNKLLSAMQDGRKIEAIKEYRTLTNTSLLDAKNAVEAYWSARVLPADPAAA